MCSLKAVKTVTSRFQMSKRTCRKVKNWKVGPTHGQKSRTFEPAHQHAAFSTITEKKINMAATKRSVCEVDYEQLHCLSSVVLYDTATKKCLDVWRYISYRKGTASQHRGHVLYSKHDFARLTTLPEYWWYYLNQHGEGVAVDFPIKIKPVLTWSPVQHVKKAGKLVKASQFPIEKLCVTVVKRACDINNLDQVQ